MTERMPRLRKLDSHQCLTSASPAPCLGGSEREEKEGDGSKAEDNGLEDREEKKEYQLSIMKAESLAFNTFEF